MIMGVKKLTFVAYRIGEMRSYRIQNDLLNPLDHSHGTVPRMRGMRQAAQLGVTQKGDADIVPPAI